MILFKNHVGNEAWRIVLDVFLFFKRALHEVEASGFVCNLVPIYIDIPQLGIQ